jgi:Na+/proline symporter
METPDPLAASTPATPAAHQVVVIERKGNGLAVAGFVCGLIGAIFGLIPLLFWIAFPLGVLGLVFGGIAWHRARRDAERGGKGLAIAAVILGLLALVLAIIGIVIIDNAFE